PTSRATSAPASPAPFTGGNDRHLPLTTGVAERHGVRSLPASPLAEPLPAAPRWVMVSRARVLERGSSLMGKKQATTQETLLAGVVGHPEEDGPRLVYADWREENGQPEWAQLTRAQIDLARLPRDDPRRAELLDASVRLHQTHGRDW